jgi:hypothetical protein
MRIGGPYDWALHAGEDGEPDTLAITIRLRVIRDTGATSDHVTQIRRAVAEAFDAWINRPRVLLPEFQPGQLPVGSGSRRPSADQRWRLNVTVELLEETDFSQRVHGTVAIRPGEPTSEEPMRQAVWYAGMATDDRKRATFVHEGLHWLGVLDEKRDPHLMLRSASPPSPPLPDGYVGVMASHKEAGADDSFVITDDHLQQILEVARPYLSPSSRVAVPSRLLRDDQGLGLEKEEDPLAVGVDIGPPVDWNRVLDDRENVVEVKPSWVYRAYEVGPERVFEEGLFARNPENRTTVEMHWKTGGRDQYVSTTTDKGYVHLSRQWLYYITPSVNGIDVPGTMAKQGIPYWSSFIREKEVIFTDHIPRSDIHGVKDMTTRLYYANPRYRPGRRDAPAVSHDRPSGQAGPSSQAQDGNPK